MFTKKLSNIFGLNTFLVLFLLTLGLFASSTLAQRPNPVDRQVTNPINDKPELNPARNDSVILSKPSDNPPLDVLEIYSENGGAEIGTPGKEVIVYEGNVIARIGTYRLQADKLILYKETNLVVAEGNVILDQAANRITGSRAEWNFRTKLGFFINSTGFTDQTDDGTVMYFTADRVDRTSLDTYVLTNAEVTACDEAAPKWSFKSRRANIKVGNKIVLKATNFKIKTVPVFFMPYASISLKKQDRKSGFLLPTISDSGLKGIRLSNAFYLTLGRSADVTFRNDIYSQRGIGLGLDLRIVPNSRSFFNMGFYAVKDRIFGHKKDNDHPDQGGSSFYVEGVHHFSNGFLAAADVDITSSLAYRQIFSDGIQQVISPEERSQIYINKNSGDYSLNLLARTQVTSLPSVRIRTRSLPSISLDKRPSRLSFLKNVPLYFSFAGGLDGVSRKESPFGTVESFREQVGGDPLVTPSVVQRFDFHPQVLVPFTFKGLSMSVLGGFRSTYYSNSLVPETRAVSGRDLYRGYGEFEFDFRPPALARNVRNNGSFFFRHVIEPYITYRKITGISNFAKIIRYDYLDAIASTNEIEFGLTNRFFTRRSTERVSSATVDVAEIGDNPKTIPRSSQPFETLTVTLRGKYFFDPTFGGALVPGRRNQFYPITTISGFTHGGIPRRFSPIALDIRYRPRQTITADFHTDFDTKNGGVRNASATFGISRQLIQIFSTFYYTRAVTLVPSLERFRDARGLEPGTQRGSQWSPSVFIGRAERGIYGGVSLFYDFQNRRAAKEAPLVSSTFTLGYAWDCCAIVTQYRTYDVGLRNENRIVLSFRLNGLGTFGTENFGERF